MCPIVGDFADEVDVSPSRVRGDHDGGSVRSTIGDFDLLFVGSGLREDPPFEGELIVFRIVRFRGIEGDGRVLFGCLFEDSESGIAVDHGDGVLVSLAVFGPVHTGGEISESSGIEVVLILRRGFGRRAGVVLIGGGCTVLAFAQFEVASPTDLVG